MTRLRIAVLALVVSLLVGIMPGSDASGASCTITSRTRYYTVYTTPNVDHKVRWFKIMLDAQGCYDGQDAFGMSVTVARISKSSLGGWPGLTGGPSFYLMSDGRIDFWANYQQTDLFYDTFLYARLKLSPSGVWSTSGSSVSCNFGLIGGTCSLVISSS